MRGRFASSLLSVALAFLAASGAEAQGSYASSLLSAGAAESLSEPSAAAARKRVFGRSGALRIFPLRESATADLVHLRSVIAPTSNRFRWAPVHGTRSPLLGQPVYTGELVAPGSVGMWRLEGEHADSGAAVTVITEAPLSRKTRGILNGYHIGTYPTEGSGRTDAYAPPAGFIEVTAENQDVLISEHFRLRQFITKDQTDVWPKYVALRLELIDKLELVLQELQRMGIRADRMHVMSGFRTPQYNGPGGDGRAQLSRHMYGDAADVWVDSDGNGYIDDLNGDGIRDRRDAEVILRAVERVEQKHPELIGGAGLYYENGPRSPFIHIDVRGGRSRW